MLAILGFLLTIGILVIIHEFGHYTFARLFNVKIISFSVGFGPKLLKWQGRHNQWCISAIPLGGYVRMLDEREGPVAAELLAQAFNHKPAWQKLLIALGGPLFNILFALIAYYAIGLYGVYNLKPVIISLNPTPLVQNLSQIAPNSTILSINGQPVDSWDYADEVFKKNLKNGPNINFRLEHDHQLIYLGLNFKRFSNNQDHPSLSALGLYPFKFLNRISYIEPQSAAAKAGLKEHDQILMINQHQLKSWFELNAIIKASPDKKLVLHLLRQNKQLDLELTPDSQTDENGQIFGKIGIMPTLDGQALEKNSRIKRYGPLTSISFAATSCLNLALSNLTQLGSMLNGQLSWHNLGGPVTIAKASQTALHLGLRSFVDFLALLSLSLAVMNLLPIPVLDGGHILLYTIEWIRGKPLSQASEQILFQTGLLIVLAITGLALYNDFLKLFNQ